MSVVDVLKKLFSPEVPHPDGGTAPAVRLTVQCAKCGELISARVEKAHELQDVYDEDPEGAELPVAYELVKELVGENCPNIVRVRMKFDARKRPRDFTVEGGELVHLECCE